MGFSDRSSQRSERRIVGDKASADGSVVAIGSPGSKPIRDAWKAIRADRTLQLVIAGQTVFWGLASLLGQDVLTYAKSALELGDFDAGITFVAFGIGVGAGSVLAGRLSPTHIEPGLIPFGAIGLALGTTALGVFALTHASIFAFRSCSNCSAMSVFSSGRPPRVFRPAQLTLPLGANNTCA